MGNVVFVGCWRVSTEFKDKLLLGMDPNLRVGSVKKSELRFAREENRDVAYKKESPSSGVLKQQRFS